MERQDGRLRAGDPLPEQPPPMRQQGDRWPEMVDGAISADVGDRAKPSDLDGN